MIDNIRRNNIAVFVIISILLAGLAFLAAFTYTQTVKAESCEGYCIQLGESPQDEIITVTTGSEVQFNGAKGQTHNIALEHAAVQHEDPSTYESGPFDGDEAWRVEFKKDGAYTFRDKNNSETRITVIAYTEGKDYSIDAPHNSKEMPADHYDDGHSH